MTTERERVRRVVFEVAATFLAGLVFGLFLRLISGDRIPVLLNVLISMPMGWLLGVAITPLVDRAWERWFR